MRGHYVGRSIKEKQVQEPETIESLAILRGLQQCLHLGITNLIIESNCQLVVSEIQSFEQSYSLLGNLVSEAKALMAMFKQCSIQFNHRECNGAAHKLAKHAWNVHHIMLWLGEVPEFLAQSYWLDKRQCILLFEMRIIYFVIKKKKNMMMGQG